MRAWLLSALVLTAGCIDLVSDAPDDWQRAAPDQRAPDLTLAGEASQADRLSRLEAVAANDGRTIWRRTTCDSPWTVVILAPDGTPVATRPPVISCAGYGHERFTRGETLRIKDSWNGTRWVPDGPDAFRGSFQPVPAGRYTWSITFDATLDKDEGDGTQVRLQLDLPFVVP